MTTATLDHSTFDWALARRQIQGILRLELRACLLGRRAFVTYFLAFGPVALMTMFAMFSDAAEFEGIATGMEIFAAFFHGYVRTSIFLGTLILFMSLFRSEVLRKSLHYYLLTPVRREVLVAGKFFAALIASIVVFSIATVALYILAFMPWGVGEVSRHLFQGPGLGDLLSYVGIAALASTGYGAVFLLAGVMLRNPVVAAVIIWSWEAANFILPVLLKKISVIFYLEALYPVPLPTEVFAVIADPISPFLAIFGLLVFTVAVLAVAAFQVKRMEVNYGDD